MTMMMKVFYGFTLILLALTSWLVVGFFWGFPGSGWQIAWLMAFLLVALSLGLAFKRMRARVRILTGLLILAGLFLPTSSIVAHPSLNLAGSFHSLLATTLFFLPSLGLVMVALLLHSGINHFKDWWGTSAEEGVGSRATRKQAGRTAAVLLVLSVLLLAKMLDDVKGDQIIRRRLVPEFSPALDRVERDAATPSDRHLYSAGQEDGRHDLAAPDPKRLAQFECRKHAGRCWRGAGF
jgi:hypothetical protein